MNTNFNNPCETYPYSLQSLFRFVYFQQSNDRESQSQSQSTKTNRHKSISFVHMAHSDYKLISISLNERNKRLKQLDAENREVHWT